MMRGRDVSLIRGDGRRIAADAKNTLIDKGFASVLVALPCLHNVRLRSFGSSMDGSCPDSCISLCLQTSIGGAQRRHTPLFAG